MANLDTGNYGLEVDSSESKKRKPVSSTYESYGLPDYSLERIMRGKSMSSAIDNVQVKSEPTLPTLGDKIAAIKDKYPSGLSIAPDTTPASPPAAVASMGLPMSTPSATPDLKAQIDESKKGWLGMDENTKAQLSKGLLTAGLSMMAMGGRAYKPEEAPSFAGAIGQAGLAGIGAAEQERAVQEQKASREQQIRHTQAMESIAAGKQTQLVPLEGGGWASYNPATSTLTPIGGLAGTQKTFTEEMKQKGATERLETKLAYEGQIPKWTDIQLNELASGQAGTKEQQEMARKTLENKSAFSMKVAGARGEAYNKSRVMQVFDAEQNKPVLVSGKIAMENPQRYTPLAGAAEFQADKQTLIAMEKQEAASKFTGKLAHNSAELLKTAMKNYGPGDIPKINAAAMIAIRNMGSAEDMGKLSAYEQAIYAYSREYVRAMSGGALSVAQLHAATQEKSEELFKKTAAPAQMNAAIEQSLLEVDQFQKSWKETTNELRNKMSTRPPSPSGATGMPGAKTSDPLGLR